MIYDRERALLSGNDPRRLFTILVVQHSAAISATAELLFNTETINRTLNLIFGV